MTDAPRFLREHDAEQANVNKRTPCSAEAEKSCREPWWNDDGVPYCETCGLYRSVIHYRSVIQAQELQKARRRTP